MLLTNRQLIALQETLSALIGNAPPAFRSALGEPYAVVSELVGAYHAACAAVQEALDALHAAELTPFEEAKQVLQHQGVRVDAQRHVSLVTATSVKGAPVGEKAEALDTLEGEYKASLDKRAALLADLRGLYEQEVPFVPTPILLVQVPVEIIGAYREQVNVLIDAGIVTAGKEEP